MLTILAGGPDGVAQQETRERLPELLAGSGIVWVDLESPTPEEAAILSTAFRFHPLAIEDAMSEINQPKIDDYGSYVYLVAHGIVHADVRGELRTSEIDCFLGPRYVVTYHEAPLANVTDTRRRVLEVPGFLGRGADWLLHSLLDRLADTYVSVVDRLDEDIDQLERSLFQPGRIDRGVLADIFAFKRDILRLKRVIHPARDVYARIARGDYAVVRPEVAPHFRDVYDHIYRVADMLDNFRDVVTASLETYLSVVSQRTNDVVKVLTILSAILMTTSLLAGIYGMNFTWLPGAHAPHGFWYMIGAMVASSLALLAYFRAKHWI